MKVAALIVTASASSVHPDRLAQIAEVQRTPGVSWRAAAHPRFATEAPGASKHLCGLLPGWRQDLEDAVEAGRIHRISAELTAENFAPESFDSATQWPHCADIIGDIRDQSNCGCCWAFAAAEAASDRMCIATDGVLKVPLSAQDVCFCASHDGCKGGTLDGPWEYIGNQGVVSGGQYEGSDSLGTGTCSSFSLPHCHHHGPQGDDPFPAEGDGCPSQSSPQCPTTCDVSAEGEHTDFASDKYTFEGQTYLAGGVSGIQKLILGGGPVEVMFQVYSDFEDYAGGIYHHVTGTSVGGHAVKIVGWGSENGVDYWRAANSWNKYWGEDGHFRIRRGVNEAYIEDQAVASSPGSTWKKMSSFFV